MGDEGILINVVAFDQLSEVFDFEELDDDYLIKPL
jgi:hypothetical protein